MESCQACAKKEASLRCTSCGRLVCKRCQKGDRCLGCMQWHVFSGDDTRLIGLFTYAQLCQQVRAKRLTIRDIVSTSESWTENHWRVGEFLRVGYVDGRPHGAYADTVSQMVEAGRTDEAEALLLRMVVATESEVAAGETGAIPWYYQSLADIYDGRDDRESEITVLERFAQQKHARGASPPRLLARLAKRKEEGGGK